MGGSLSLHHSLGSSILQRLSDLNQDQAFGFLKLLHWGLPDRTLGRALSLFLASELTDSILRALLSAQSCPTLCNPMDCSPPGSTVHGIL